MSVTTHLDPRAAPPRRPGLALASLVHALVFAGAAVMLPWGGWGAFSITSGFIAAHHGLVAAAALGPASWLLPAWRALSWVSLGYMLGWGWAAWTSAHYLAGLYGSLGQGVGWALLAAFSPIVTLTLPFALWGFRATRHDQTPRSGKWWVVLVAATAGTSWSARRGSDARVVMDVADVERLAAGLGELAFESSPEIAAEGRNAPRRVLEPSRCDLERPSAIVWAGGDMSPACVSADDIDALHAGLAAHLAGLDSAHAVASVDLVTAVGPLTPPNDLVSPLSIRPGRDGVCAGDRCLAAWQLIGHEAFSTHRPVPFIADLRVGVDLDVVRRLLGAGPDETLRRIETRTFRLARGESSVELGTETNPVLDGESLRRSLALVQRHVLRAQQDDGAFRYKLHAITGQTAVGESLARQAGTLLVLCQLGGREPAVAEAIARAAEAIAGHRVDEGAVSFVTSRPNGEEVRLGPTALTLAAFVECRDRLSEDLRATIAPLTRFVLAVQREDGRFASGWDRAHATPREGPQQLFAAGQATYALALVAGAGESGIDVRSALGRAMHHYGREYWDHPAASFFFVEENWHCLAAAAAPPDARNDAYEQFCLDYVQFKRRLQLDEDSDVDPRFLGGYGFGNLIPPHTTATAGLGEALTAALAIARARGDVELGAELRASLGAALRNLVARQWDDARCHACVRPARTLGGFTESPASPVMRIDYAQHAWAALGHGGRALGLLGDEHT